MLFQPIIDALLNAWAKQVSSAHMVTDAAGVTYAPTAQSAFT